MATTSTTSTTSTTPQKKRSDGINPYVLLFFILVAAAIATWIVPAGQYASETKVITTIKDGVETQVKSSYTIPGSYERLPEQHGVLPGQVFTSIADGLVKAAPIIFLIIFTGGALHLLETTGAINKVLSNISRSKKLNDFLLITIFFVVFSILGTTGIVVNSIIAFVPIGLLVAKSVGMDDKFGAAIVYVAAYSGFNASVMAPMTVGLSQGLADVPLLSAFGFRTVVYISFVIAGIIFLTLYAKKCRRQGMVRPDVEIDDSQFETSKISLRHVITLSYAAFCLIGFIFGAIEWSWGEKEMMAMFIILGVGVGVLNRMSANDIATGFLKGCAGMVGGAFIVGMARAIAIVLADGMILDTIVNSIISLMDGLPKTLSALSMFGTAAIMHFFISSGSGEAAVLVPIFTPMGDLLEITRQTTVQTVLMGEGVVNCINPTSGILMAVLATSKIPYTKWLKFIWPLVLTWVIISIISIVYAVVTNLGPI
ncbi:TPA: YfcC family protein [Providencia alcalifaciens]|uniref:YfcC family protein n=1 Tax=Providencia TaxID=586 RepID=UPI0012B5428A|nr:MULTISPECIES: Na+/H+ antiporter NhaC family protein [Providencia]MBF0690028.1 YfcC family protein [Providencia alcalifaciens]MTC51258.1 YfcC family protein [Providencia alcalifaciens]NYS88532.1 YfcC family protein [Providencia alcalifaciens]